MDVFTSVAHRGRLRLTSKLTYSRTRPGCGWPSPDPMAVGIKTPLFLCCDRIRNGSGLIDRHSDDRVAMMRAACARLAAQLEGLAGLARGMAVKSDVGGTMESQAIWTGRHAPWTPTSKLTKRKHLTKRSQYMMETLSRELEQQSHAKNFPEFRAGNILECTLMVPENRRRTTVVKGLCIAKNNAGWNTSFTIRNIVGNIPIERSFPLHSPNLVDLKVVGSKRVRRAKLYYLRELGNKFSRV